MISLLVELLVSVLLATSIGYSVVLERRLRRLRADDEQMRKTIVDLVTATDSAERAIVNLKTLAADCDRTLTASLREAELRSAELAEHIRSGDEVIARIARIVETAKSASSGAPSAFVPLAPSPAAPESRPQGRLAGTLAAAQAFADRARQRAEGKAA